jgi:hypothetical protein
MPTISSAIYEKLGRAVAARWATAEFAGKERAKAKCKPGNISCGKICISGDKICRQDATEAQKEKIVEVKKEVRAKSKTKKAEKKPVDTPEQKPAEPKKEPEAKAPEKKAKPVETKAPEQPQVKTNQKNLTAAADEIKKVAGEEAVKAAEKATADILNSSDTGLFVRVGGNQTLDSILGDRFKNSVELGSDANVPGLVGSYQEARKRVEAEQLGYSADHDPTKRPIYAYLGDAHNTKSLSHQDAAAFGDISIKLKDDVKSRASFTGADTFKSGVASSITAPSAASLIQSRKHGHPEPMDGVKDTLNQVAKAKNVNDLMAALPTDGNRYMEAQIHGQLKPEHIAEIHYHGAGEPPTPTKAVRDWAEKNGVKLFKDGKPYVHFEVSEQRRKEIAATVTPEDFREFTKAKANRARQDDTESVHNQTYEKWQTSEADRLKNSSFYSKTLSDPKSRQKYLDREIVPHKYHAALDKAASSGLNIPTHVMESIPQAGKGRISAKQIKELQAKSAKNVTSESRSRYHRELESILDSPVLSEADMAGYKPKMTEKEAAAYVKGSVYADHTFYHGTHDEAAKSIVGGGVRISANKAGMFGGGFYTASEKETADHYAGGDAGARVISLKAKVKNPYVLDKTDDLKAMVAKLGGGDAKLEEIEHVQQAFGGRFGDPGMAHFTALLKLKGFDGVFLKSGGYAIGFEKEQHVAFNVEEGSRKPHTENLDPLADPQAKTLINKFKATKL